MCVLLMSLQPQSSFFVRSIAIWINDFVVVSLIFGSLIYNVHYCDFSQSDYNDRPGISRQLSGRMTKKSEMDSSSHRVIQAGLEKYAERVGRKSVDKRRKEGSTSDFSTDCSRFGQIPPPSSTPPPPRAVNNNISSVDNDSESSPELPNSRGSSIMSLFSSTSTVEEEEPVVLAASNNNMPELSPMPPAAAGPASTTEAHPRAA